MLAAGFPLVAFLQLVRVYVQSMRRIADAEVRLFHLYVHEPLIRDAVPELEMAEEMGELAADILPLAAPLTEYLHTRYLRFFLEQDVVGHMETELGDDTAEIELGQVPVTLCFIDLTGFTRYTEEEGDIEALDVVENFVATVEATLPPEATIVKTIGDEVMVVSPDPASLTEWAVGLLARFPQRPRPRVGIHYGDAVYRDGDYFGSQVNLAHRVVNRAQAGEVLVTDAVADAIAARERLELRADRRGQPQGLPDADRAVRRPRRMIGGRELLERVASRRPARRRRRRSWRCSPAGGTRSACSTSRCGCAGPEAVTRAARQLRPARGGRRGRAPLRRAMRAARRAAGGRAAAAPRGAGNLQAWAREVRYAAAARLARAARGDDRHRPHRRRPGRDDPLPARLLAEPAGAAGDAPARRAAWCGRCSASPARETTAYCEERGLRLARRRRATRSRAYARNRVRHGLAAALAEVHPAAARERAAHGRRCCARRRRCSTRSSTPSWPARTGSRRGTIPLEPLRRAAPGAAPPRRSASRRRGPPGGRWPAPPATPTQVAGLSRGGSASSTSAAASGPSVEQGVVRAERLAGPLYSDWRP